MKLPPTPGITRQQRELLEFLVAYIAMFGYSPSFDEMAPALGLKSKSGISRLVDELERAGYLQRARDRARGLVPKIKPALEDFSTNALFNELDRCQGRIAA